MHRVYWNGANCWSCQGSVLGAILFIIYINYLCNAWLRSKITSSIDDTAFSYVADTWVEVHKDMIRDLKDTQCWFTINHMILNVE